MKPREKQLDWFTIAMRTLIVLGLAVNPFFWILAVTGLSIIFVIAYGLFTGFGIAGSIVFLLLVTAVLYLSRKYGLD